MHRANDPQVRELSVSHFLFRQGSGDDADDFAACLQNRLGDLAHGADARPAIDKPKVLAGQRVA
jgi:hypothetical protein